ncbi:MAG: ABC transporter ATP-binding protein [Proteobacteria bacterium]|jgi:ABC-2 type transport system ATP-binding protein|nr:ABC transporter ATP-binding protein [Pseudomonadota bacterium]
MYALEINHVVKRYGSFTALNDINFKIEAGEFVGLLGVNGAGKTSLISSIAGINNFEGEIKVAGYNVISEVVKSKQSLGVVPQELAFDPFLTVYQALKFQSGLYGVKNNKEWLFEVIERMHLTDKINSNTRTLSGGMKRRLMVAQALVHKPPVIILDEPTTGVDVEIRQSLWGFIAQLHKSGHTILLTTHYLEEVEKLCNKIIMIDKGKIISQSTKENLIAECSTLPTTLEIETQDAKFIDSLEHLILKKDGSSFTLKLENNEQLLDILNQFRDAGIILENINIKKPSLEDIFIHFIHR